MSSKQPASTHSSQPTDGAKQSSSSPVGIAPLCACGCGQTPKWNPRWKRWGTYVFGHRRTSSMNYSEWKASMRPIKKGEAAPLCLCGCGNPVKRHPLGAGHFWANYLKSHQMRGRRGIHTPEAIARTSQRMRLRNPMFDPKVAAKANRTRMLAESPTKVELRFSKWTKANGLPISFRGNGKLWINRRNPDFRVIEQKKAIEITTTGIFNGGSVEMRTAETYGAKAVSHYTASGWACLVIFCSPDHRHRLPAALLPVVIDFCSRGSNWSGVWNYDRLIRSAESPAACASITSPARRSKRTKQTVS